MEAPHQSLRPPVALWPPGPGQVRGQSARNPNAQPQFLAQASWRAVQAGPANQARAPAAASTSRAATGHGVGGMPRRPSRLAVADAHPQGQQGRDAGDGRSRRPTLLRIRPPWRSITAKLRRGRSAATALFHFQGPALRLPAQNLAFSLPAGRDPQLQAPWAHSETPSRYPWRQSSRVPRKKAQPLRTRACKCFSGTSINHSARDADQGSGRQPPVHDQRTAADRWHPPTSRGHSRLRPSRLTAGLLGTIRSWIPGAQARALGFQAQAPRPSPHIRPPTLGAAHRKSERPPKGRSACHAPTAPAGHATGQPFSGMHQFQLAGELLDGPDRQGGFTEGSPAQIGQPVDKQHIQLMSADLASRTGGPTSPPPAPGQRSCSAGPNRQRAWRLSG